MRSKTPVLALGLAIILLAMPATAAAQDSTPPEVTVTIDGIAGTNNWYRGSSQGNFVIVRWSVSEPESPSTLSTSGCEPAIKIDGPNTGTTRKCTATSEGGTTEKTTKVIKIDADPPTGVLASVSRGSDFNGWYNHPFAIRWGGSDAMSGIAGCTSLTYGGPDVAGGAVSGGCTDVAGNTALAPLALNYDATPPGLDKVSVASGAGVDVVHWSSSSPADTIVVRRAARGSKTEKTVFQGSAASFSDKRIQSGLEYVYELQAYDQAGNWSQKVTAAGLPKVLTLRKTPYTPRAARKPILRWAAVRGASYYHVQLFRGSKRILALWPGDHQVGLPAAWKWAGKRYRLGPGRYRWYVWAGIGRRAFANYKTLGSAQFIVPHR
jgi:hypothetical protein